MARNLCEYAEDSNSIGRQSTDEPWKLKNVDETIALGAKLIELLPNLKLLLLQGPLGAGKTCLVKGLASSLGIKEPITSPTFALAQHYLEGSSPLVHLDLYRLETPQAANELFLQEEEEAESLGALMVVEWPERLSLHLPEAWKINLEYLSNGEREARLTQP